MITGLLLAAGRGKRLGGTKQLVSWPAANGGSKPLVAAAFDAISPVCDSMIVVLGHEREQVEKALAARKFTPVNSDPDGEMFDSILAGLRCVDPKSRVLLQPGDHPTVRESTLHAMIAESTRSPRRAIVPTCQSKGGHPILIPASIASDLQAASIDGGLNAYWAAHPESRLCLEVDDVSIHCGINTREELSLAIELHGTNEADGTTN